MSAPLCTVAPLEALRRCVAVLKQVDYADCGESEALWCQHALALSEAEAVLAAPVVPVAAQPVVPEVPPSVLARTEEIRKLMGNHTSISRSTLLSYIEFLLAHIAFTNAPQPAASVTDVAKDAASWMPIQTAPKDGTRFLAVHEGKVGFWHWQGEPNAIVGWRDSFIYVFRDGDGPTHWMKLPEIPAAIAAQQGEKTK